MRFNLTAFTHGNNMYLQCQHQHPISRLCGSQLHLHTVQCGHYVSLTSSRGGLADRITIHPQCVLGEFTPVLMVRHCPIAVRSPKTHYNARFKGGHRIYEISVENTHHNFSEHKMSPGLNFQFAFMSN